MANHFLPEEQEHRSYYERMERKRLKDAALSMKVSVVLIVLWLLGLLMVACGPKPYALIPEAIPMKQDGDRVLGVFQSLEGSPERYHAQWFYFPRMGLINPHEYRIRVILERRHP